MIYINLYKKLTTNFDCDEYRYIQVLKKVLKKIAIQSY